MIPAAAPVREENKAPVGHIHSIETFGTVDGGGIRFVIFLKGCPMRCQFCHNPDTWAGEGETLTVDEVMGQLRGYRRYFALSGGGVTVSGGEPMAQWEFVRALFEACGRAGIHRVLDTSGFAAPEHFAAVLEVTDRVLFCLKVVDPEKHRNLTGQDNTMIFQNLSQACQAPVELVIRYVLLPGVNDTRGDLEALAREIHCRQEAPAVELLPYHRMGVHKWQELGLTYDLDWVREPTPEDLDRAVGILNDNGIRVLR